MQDRVYLDWNATTPLRPEAREAMAAAWDLPGNPSSVHAEGRQARRLVEEARAAISGAVGALPRDVIFTSGGNQANVRARAIWHASVLAGWRCPAEAIGTVGVTKSGLLDLDRLRALLEGGPPALV